MLRALHRTARRSAAGMAVATTFQQHRDVSQWITASTRPSIAQALLRDEASFHHMMMRSMQRHPKDKVAFKCAASGETLKYGDILPLVEKYAAVLYHRYGVRAGDRVLLMCPNTPKYIALFHAVLHLGAVLSPVNSLSTATEIKKQAGIANAKVAIAHTAFKGLFADPDLASALNVCYHDADFAGVDALPETARAPEIADPSDTIILPFSSGTTGLPKGVELTNRSLVANLLQTHASIKFNSNDVMLSVLPFFHIYGLTAKLHAVADAGASQITFPKFDMETYLDAMQNDRATLAFVAPPIMVGFVKHPKMATIDASSVRIVLSGAAPLSEEVQRMCEPVFKRAVIGQGYGLTETSPIVAICLEEGMYGRAGSLVSDTEARIVHEDDSGAFRDMATGEEGELLIRGPQVMKGYLRAEDTQQVMQPCADGAPWFRTGDLGKFDSEGQLIITDRLKELIKYKGFQVAPAELEGVLQQHPDVQEAIVVGVPTDDGRGELAKAHVVLKPGKTASPAEEQALQQHVASLVAPSKQLRGGVKFVDAIPKTASGKLLRRVVRDQERAEAAKQQ